MKPPKKATEHFYLPLMIEIFMLTWFDLLKSNSADDKYRNNKSRLHGINVDHDIMDW